MIVPRVTRIVCVAIALGSAGPGEAGGRLESVPWFQKAVYSTNPDHQIAYYRKALSIDPTLDQAKHNLAGVYYRKGDYGRSIRLYESIIRSGKAYHQTFYNLACCYARIGDPDHALKALRRAIQKGFRDTRLLEGDLDLAPLRHSPEFARLLALEAPARGARRAPSPDARVAPARTARSRPAVSLAPPATSRPPDAKAKAKGPTAPAATRI
jgi:tetratricopeptide (TPR) repeat protein